MPLGIPDYLYPASQTERDRLKLLETQTANQAVLQLRRQVGLRQMQRDAQMNMENGMDPIVARRHALMNAAPLLFSDNPQAIVQLQHNEQADAIRAQAAQQLANYREALVDARNKATEAGNERAALMADFKIKQLELTGKENEAKHERFLADAERKSREFSERMLQEERNRQQRETAARLHSDTQKEIAKGRQKIDVAKLNVKVQESLEKDPEFQSLLDAEDRARTAYETAQKKQTSNWIFKPSEEQIALLKKRVEEAAGNVEKRRSMVKRQLREELEGALEPEPQAQSTDTAEPAPAEPDFIATDAGPKSKSKRFKFVPGEGFQAVK